jgi:error-prone DNA polymerase
VNHSGRAFTLDPDGVRLWMGLRAVRELTRATTGAILAERPFDSLEDLLVRAHPQYVETVNLIKAGALAGLGSSKAMLTTLERRRWHGRHTAQLELGLAADEPEMAPLTVHERAAWEREVLGDLVSLHALDLVAEELASHDLTPSDRLGGCHGQEVRVAGVRLASQRFRAHGEEPMQLADMEDRAGIYQVLWRGAALERYRTGLSGREPVLIRGRVGPDRQGLTVVQGRELQRL